MVLSVFFWFGALSQGVIHSSCTDAENNLLYYDDNYMNVYKNCTVCLQQSFECLLLQKKIELSLRACFLTYLILHKKTTKLH